VEVTKKFDEITALDNLNLSVDDGEYVCILGQTGAGKTSLLRIIAGLLDPDEGQIFIGGSLVNDKPPEERNAVYMFQQFALFPHMNVWQNVSFGPIMNNLDKGKTENITKEILEMVRLGERSDAFPKELSGGMQQRVALARGIASGARILLLDEPLGALDARLRVDIRIQLKKLVKDQGLTALHVTHDQEEALMTADRIVVLRKGRIEQTGSPHEIFSKPKSIFIMNFVGGANFIEGTISDSKKSDSSINIQGGKKIIVSKVKYVKGEKIVIAIRLEDVSINDVSAAELNSFSGKVESKMFMGAFIEYRLKLDNDIELISRVLPSDEIKTFDNGDRVVVSLPKERCYIFPYPTSGLLQEIEAI
jgi:ABC-type Fe3+/spermidine/putrescine transport system ATPase subunit